MSDYASRLEHAAESGLDIQDAKRWANGQDLELKPDEENEPEETEHES